jgi:hypothetical protein
MHSRVRVRLAAEIPELSYNVSSSNHGSCEGHHQFITVSQASACCSWHSSWLHVSPSDHLQINTAHLYITQQCPRTRLIIVRRTSLTVTSYLIIFWQQSVGGKEACATWLVRLPTQLPKADKGRAAASASVWGETEHEKEYVMRRTALPLPWTMDCKALMKSEVPQWHDQLLVGTLSCHDRHGIQKCSCVHFGDQSTHRPMQVSVSFW